MSATRRRLTISLVLTLISLVALWSCSRDQASRTAATLPTGVGAAADAALAKSAPAREPGLFFPLVSGNRWTYERETTAELHPLGDTTVFRGSTIDDVTRSIDCESVVGGTSWWVETDRSRERGQNVDRIEWLRLRQDRTGLYELEVIPTDPYPCGPLAANTAGASLAKRASQAQLVASIRDARFRRAAAAALERLSQGGDDPLRASLPPRAADIGATTLTRLSYPLTPSATWAIRPETDAHGAPVFTARVEAHETLHLPAGVFPAWRIRLNSPFYSPDDSIVLWYGRAGYLGLDNHFEFLITDETGTVIGTGVADTHERITGIAPASVAVDAPTPEPAALPAER